MKVYRFLLPYLPYTKRCKEFPKSHKKKELSTEFLYLLFSYIPKEEEALLNLYCTKIQINSDIGFSMKNELRNKYFSRPRQNRYLIATLNDKKRAKRLYNANIRLAQSIHPILTQFEVVLRNSLNIQLSSYFIDNDWIINQKNGFMKNPSLAHSRYFIKNSIIKTERKLNRRGIPVTSGKIISDQTFGFWIALFLSHHYALIGGQPIQIFAHKPTSEDRASIYSKLDDVRKFRNRVNHCEPLCFNDNKIDCSEILEIRSKLYDLISWIEPELIPFFENIDSVQNKVDNTLRI